MKHFKLYMVIVSLLLLVTLVTLIIQNQRNNTVNPSLETPLEKFIWVDMLNDNQLLKTQYKANNTDYSLSESLGLWMAYAVESDNEVLFELGYQQLTNYFLTKQGSIHWRVLLNGKSTESVNALLDDLRIIEALIDASEKWNKPTYQKTAQKITNTLVDKGTYQQLFVDFYDWEHDSKSNTLSTAYLDLITLEKLDYLNWINDELYEQMHQVANEVALKSNPLFPTRYKIDQKTFTTKDTVNMIEQVYTAYHLSSAGIATDRFHAFLKKEFNKAHKLYGQYNTKTLEPSVSYESPALYGMMIRYSLQKQDSEFALAIYDQLQSLRIEGKSYMDTATNNTHIFDNLVPLIAERGLQKHALIR